MLLSLTSYLKFRNWRLLFLSVAFFLLAIPPTIHLIAYSGLVSQLPSGSSSVLFGISFIFSTASVISFALLAYVYFNERKTQSIEISRAQWVIGGFLILAEVGFAIYVVNSSSGYLDLSSASTSSGYPALLNFLLGSVAYVLIILIIISLFSYYRAKNTRTTLVVMIGFVCLLFSQGYGIFIYFLYVIPDQSYYLGYGLVTSFELAGYIAFLAALLRLKVFR
jgi:hypothetical protein